MSSAHMRPMTQAEVTELLGATLHGSLPHETQQRLMASVAAAYELLGGLLDPGYTADDIRHQTTRLLGLPNRTDLWPSEQPPGQSGEDEDGTAPADHNTVELPESMDHPYKTSATPRGTSCPKCEEPGRGLGLGLYECVSCGEEWDAADLVE